MGHKMGGDHANKTWHFPENVGTLYGFGRRKQIPDTWRAYTKVFYSGCKAAEKDYCEGNDKE